MDWPAYVRTCADALGLKDWSFAIDTDPPASEWAAWIEPSKGRKVARLSLGPEFHQQTPEQQRQTVCHELLHAHLDNVKRAFEMLTGKVHPDAFDVAYESLILHLELGIDGIAEAIAHTLPRPE